MSSLRLDETGKKAFRLRRGQRRKQRQRRSGLYRQSHGVRSVCVRFPANLILERFHGLGNLLPAHEPVDGRAALLRRRID